MYKISFKDTIRKKSQAFEPGFVCLHG